MSIVITVSRQLGSRGSYIATAIAKTLGLRYIDREILNRAAEMAGFPDPEMVAHLEKKERVPTFLERIVSALNTMPMIPTIASATLREGYAYDEQLALLMVQENLSRDEAYEKLLRYEQRAEASASYAELVRQVIQEYAQLGDVILVGRGSQVILHDLPNACHLRVRAPETLRVSRLVERLGIEPKEAERQIHQSDKERNRYMHHYYNVDWDDPDLYHLVINTGKVSVDLTTHLVSETARRIAMQIS